MGPLGKNIQVKLWNTIELTLGTWTAVSGHSKPATFWNRKQLLWAASVAAKRSGDCQERVSHQRVAAKRVLSQA
jgi:hypothetical protein